ncbi:RNA helicase [Aphelenchoides fujianensis]|nr:RNA helicase [Aphelenchoides fujianensis]
MISPAPTEGSSLAMDAPPPSPVENIWDDDWQPPPRSQLAYTNSYPDSQFEFDAKTEPYERAPSGGFSPTLDDEHFNWAAPKREPLDDHADDRSDLYAVHSPQLDPKDGVEETFASRSSTPLSLLLDSSFKADADEPTEEEPLDTIYALDNELEVVGDGLLPPVIDSWKEAGFSPEILQNVAEAGTGVLVNAAYGEYHLNKNKESIHRDGCDIIEVPFDDRKIFLFDFLKKLKEENGGEVPKTLMFVEGKRDADLLAGALCLLGISSHTVNSDRTQQQREEELTRANQEVPAFLIKAVEAVAEQPVTSVGQPLATIPEISEPEFD